MQREMMYFYMGDLADRTGFSVDTVSRSLKYLVDIGVLRKEVYKQMVFLGDTDLYYAPGLINQEG